MRQHFSWRRALLFVVLPLTTLSVSRSARADLDYLVTLKDGSTYQGALVEYAPNDHVTLHLATGETKRFAWTQIAMPNLPPVPMAPVSPPAVSTDPEPQPAASDSTTPTNDGSVGPKAGTWSATIRIPFGFTFSDPSPSLQGWGFDANVGTRVTDRVYLGGLAGVSQVWDLGGGDPLMFAKTRAGGDLDFIVHQSKNQGVASGHYQWIGLRGGAEGVKSLTPTGAFAEIDYGTGSWFGASKLGEFSSVFGAGLSFEPPGAYGASSTDPENPTAASPSPQGRTVSPYLTAAFQFGLGG
jgi:hypothetical protein